MSVRFNVPVHSWCISSFPNSSSQGFEYSLCVIPADARICNTNAVLQAFLAFWWYLLSSFTLLAAVSSPYATTHTFVDIALNHNAHNSFFTTLNLSRQITRHLGLILVVLR